MDWPWHFNQSFHEQMVRSFENNHKQKKKKKKKKKKGKEFSCNFFFFFFVFVFFCFLFFVFCFLFFISKSIIPFLFGRFGLTKQKKGRKKKKSKRRKRKKRKENRRRKQQGEPQQGRHKKDPKEVLFKGKPRKETLAMFGGVTQPFSTGNLEFQEPHVHQKKKIKKKKKE